MEDCAGFGVAETTAGETGVSIAATTVQTFARQKGKIINMRKRNRIGVPEVRRAAELLAIYRRGRSETEKRMLEEENWFRMRVMPHAHRNTEGEQIAPTSAWLLNAILQKHADMMEKIPTAVCLAREPGDEADAKALSEILPVILERGEFPACYSRNMWTKLKHGFCLYGVFWNTELQNGIGDIDVRRVDPLQFYVEPGVQDLQESRSVFYTQTVEKSEVLARFPQCRRESLADIEGSDGKVLVVDWYYKKRNASGRKVLHYCKFSGDAVLFATENEPQFENGWYEHGEYPFVIDVMYPVEGECTGFGLIAIAKDPQTYIDRMDRNLMEYMDWATRVRYFCKKNTGINEADFADVTRRVVEVEGDLGEERLRQITVEPLGDIWLQLKTAKVDELKETTFNRNVLQGYSESGITAAAAIAALQEAGGKGVRDIVSSSYRAFVRIVKLIIECVRQFYGEERYFRVMGENGYRYVSFSGSRIREKNLGIGETGMPLCRVPVFDIDVHAEEQDAYTRVTLNDNLKELYRLGVFSPENRESARLLLSSMDFPGAKKLLAGIGEQSIEETPGNTNPPEGGTMPLKNDPVRTAFSGAARVTVAARDKE